MYLNDMRIPNNRFAGGILKSYERTVQAETNDMRIPNNRFAGGILLHFLVDC